MKSLVAALGLMTLFSAHSALAASACEATRIGGAIANDGSNDNREVIQMPAPSWVGNGNYLVISSNLLVTQITSSEVSRSSLAKVQQSNPNAVIVQLSETPKNSTLILISKPSEMNASISAVGNGSALEISNLSYSLVCTPSED